MDSVAVVATAAQCDGVGLGFISRLGDSTLVLEMLRGVITSHPEFRVVSAFYKTEIIEVDSQRVRTAHALSVIRSVGVTAVRSRS